MLSDQLLLLKFMDISYVSCAGFWNPFLVQTVSAFPIGFPWNYGGSASLAA